MKLKEMESPKVLVSITTPQDVMDTDFMLDENYMYKLTKYNAKKAYDLIKKHYNDSSYEVYYNIEKREKSLEKYDKYELTILLKKIAVSNSTRTPNSNIEILADYIIKNRKEVLKRIKFGDIELVDELTYIDGFSRREKSFASKVCSYLCKLEFEQSKFPINDNVVRTILPYYLNYYGVEIPKKKLEECSYKELKILVDRLNKELPESMKYDEIDNIIWYCYKDDSVRTVIATHLF